MWRAHESLPVTDALYIGLMSGTSLDGVDAVLADFSGASLQVVGHAHLAFTSSLREELLALQVPGDNELHRAARASNALAEHYAQIVKTVLRQSGLSPGAITAIGAHGQTVRHQPDAGYTVQLNAPAKLAEASEIDVVADFRSRDIAAGGQGAPLVPAFHAAVFGHPLRHRVILNIGGIANVTVLPPDAGGTSVVRGWDCGPGNVFLDRWAAMHEHGPFDRGGQWAATGEVLPSLFSALLTEPWLLRAPPKSTGRDLFNDAWLLARMPASVVRAEDVQATLAEFTAHTIAQSISQHAPLSEEIILCGGGAYNADLVSRLERCVRAALGHHVTMTQSRALGFAPEHVEALAFAWLARCCLRREPGNVPSVTGARAARILGAIYPANSGRSPLV